MDTVQIVEELESITQSATRVPGLRRRVMVDVDRLTQVTEQVGTSIPSDILEAKEILKQKDSIISQSLLEARRVKEKAENESLALKAEAEREQASRINETEIVRAAEEKSEGINQEALQESQQIIQDAQRRAYRIVDEAERAASVRREGSDQYAKETLFDLEERLSSLTAQIRRGIDALGVETETRSPASPSHDPVKETVVAS